MIRDTGSQGVMTREKHPGMHANCKVRKSITYEWAGFARHGCICGSQCVNLSYKP